MSETDPTAHQNTTLQAQPNVQPVNPPAQPETLAQKMERQQKELEARQKSLNERILRETQASLAPMPKENKDVKKFDGSKLSDNVKALLQNLDDEKPETLDNFGTGIIDQNTQAAAKVLDSVQTKQTAEIGNQLVRLSKALKEVPNTNKKQNWLLNIFNKVKMSTYELQTEYQKAGTTINNIGAALKTKIDILHTNNEDMKQMYNDRVAYFHALTDYIKAGEAKSQELLKTKLPMAKAAINGQTGQERFDAEQTYQGLVNYQNRLSKSIYDFRAAQTLAYQQIQQLNIIATSNIKLIDTINTSISTAIPIWYEQATMALFLKSQKEANDANKAVIDATNKMLVQNGEQMKNQAVDIVNNSEAPVIKPETLESNYNNILTAVQNCQDIIDNAEHAREEDKNKLIKMNNEFHKQIDSALTGHKASNMLNSLQDTQDKY